MVLLKIEPPCVAVDPLESDPPRPVDREGLPLGHAPQLVEPEARHVQVLWTAGAMQRIQPAPRPLDQVGSGLTLALAPVSKSSESPLWRKVRITGSYVT